METPTGPICPVDEDALVSQVLEIIGGNAAEAPTTLVEPEEGQEEGDDSVFFSDEDQDGRGVKTKAACSSGEEQPGDGVGENEAGEEISEVPQQHLSSGGDEQLRDPEMHEAGDPSEVVDQEAQLSVPVEAESKNSVEPVEETEAPPDSQPAHLQPFDPPNEEACAARQQMSAPEPRESDRGELRAESEQQPNPGVCSPPGFHQKPRSGSSTLPLPKKTEHPNSFNHLTSARYSTVSYRQIRRGNTRQKVEKFEFLIMNL